MTHLLFAQPHMRCYLKTPLGPLYTGEAVRSLFASLDPSRTVTVGDVVTRSFIEQKGAAPLVAIIDGRTCRKDKPWLTEEYEKKFTIIVRIRNPPGFIARETIVEELGDALVGIPDDRVLVLVEGEEDLLLLLAPHIINVRPLILLYGQPGEGVVAVPLLGSSELPLGNLVSYMRLEHVFREKERGEEIG